MHGLYETPARPRCAQPHVDAGCAATSIHYGSTIFPALPVHARRGFREYEGSAGSVDCREAWSRENKHDSGKVNAVDCKSYGCFFLFIGIKSLIDDCFSYRSIEAQSYFTVSATCTSLIAVFDSVCCYFLFANCLIFFSVHYFASLFLCSMEVFAAANQMTKITMELVAHSLGSADVCCCCVVMWWRFRF